MTIKQQVLSKMSKGIALNQFAATILFLGDLTDERAERHLIERIEAAMRSRRG